MKAVDEIALEVYGRTMFSRRVPSLLKKFFLHPQDPQNPIALARSKVE